MSKNPLKRPAEAFASLYGDLPQAKPTAVPVKVEKVEAENGEERQAKKPREGDSAGQPSAGGSADADDPFGLDAILPSKPVPVKQEKEKTPEAKLQDAIVKVTLHVKNDKKFPKASAVLLAMVKNSLEATNAPWFVEALKACMFKPERVNVEGLRKPFLALFKEVAAKKACFPPDVQPLLDTWLLRAITVNEAYTDDTYQFAAAAKKLTEITDTISSHGGPEENKEYKAALVAGMEACYASFKWQWAKMPVEKLLKTATERRQHFDDKLRVTIEKMWTTVKARRQHTSLSSADFVKREFYKDDFRAF